MVWLSLRFVVQCCTNHCTKIPNRRKQFIQPSKVLCCHRRRFIKPVILFFIYPFKSLIKLHFPSIILIIFVMRLTKLVPGVNQVQKVNKSIKTFYRIERIQILQNRFRKQFKDVRLIPYYVDWQWQNLIPFQQKKNLYMIIQIKQAWQQSKKFSFIHDKPNIKQWQNYRHEQRIKQISVINERNKKIDQAINCRKQEKNRKYNSKKRQNCQILVQQIVDKEDNNLQCIKQVILQKGQLFLPIQQSMEIQNNHIQKEPSIILQKPLFQFKEDFYDESVISQPQKKNVNKYKLKGRKTIYECIHCNFVHHSKAGVFKHKKICKIRKSKINKLGIHAQNKAQAVKFQNKQTLIIQQKYGFEQKRLNKVTFQDNKMKRLQDKISDNQMIADINGQQNVQRKAIRLLDIIKDNIYEILKIKLTTFMHTYNSSLNPKLLNSIPLRLIENIINLNLQSFLIQGNSILNKSHQSIQQQCLFSNKSQKTIVNNQHSRKYLQRYSSLDFSFPSRIIYDLSNQTSHQRSNILRYYNKLQKSTIFNSYPKLPHFQSSLPWEQIKPFHNMQILYKNLLAIINNNYLTLACDFFMLICMGLQPSQLKRIYFFTKDNNPVSFIKIMNQRTGKQVIRFVPLSLISLINQTKTSYPISDKRLQLLRTNCIEKIQMFYKFGHLNMYNLLSLLHYNNYHKKNNISNIKTMIKLELDDLNHLDQIYFSNSINSGALNNYCRNIMLDLTNVSGIIKQQLMNQLKVTIDDNQQILFNHRQDCLLQGIQPQLILQAKINKQQKQQLLLRSQIFNNYNVQMLSGSAINLFDCIEMISNKMDSPQFVYDIGEMMQIGGRPFNQSQLFQAAAQLLNSYIILQAEQSLKYYSYKQQIGPLQYKKIFDQGQIHVQKDKQSNMDSQIDHLQSQRIIVAKIGNLYQLTDQKLSKIYQRSSKTKALSNIKNSLAYPLLSYRNPKCQQCKSSFQQLYYQFNLSKRGYFKCNNCKQEIHQSHRNCIGLNLCQQFRIDCLQNQYIDLQHQSMGKERQRNTTAKVIQQLNFIYKNQASYTQDIPKTFSTLFCSFSKRLSKQINWNRENQEFMPLKIQQSTIKRSGMGLFVTKDVPKNKILLSYIGTIGSNFTLKMDNDSLFHLGWLYSQLKSQNPRQILITSQMGTNAGRFINSSDTSHKRNLKAVIGILNQNQIAIYFYTTNFIKQGEQLFYDYGRLYNSDKISRQQKVANNLNLLIKRKRKEDGRIELKNNFQSEFDEVIFEEAPLNEQDALFDD